MTSKRLRYRIPRSLCVERLGYGPRRGNVDEREKAAYELARMMTRANLAVLAWVYKRERATRVRNVCEDALLANYAVDHGFPW